jgi:hypothetical protein
LQIKHLTQAHEAICRAAITLDLDILQRKTFTDIIPVQQFDIMEDLRLRVPDDVIQKLYKFWHAHIRTVNAWRNQGGA